MRWILLLAAGLMLQIGAAARQAAPSPQSGEYFESRVRPVLAANCYDCHTDEHMGGLRLDSREALLQGGASGPAIVPGDPEKSLVIDAVRQTGRLKMPKGGVLRPDEVATLADWIRAGAPWPASAAVTSTAASAGRPAPATSSPATSAYAIKPEQRTFWSFHPLRHPPVPAASPPSRPKP